MMDSNSPSMEEWRQLYGVVARLREAGPWEWMDELDNFGVVNPETGEVGYVSVMGQAGEHFAVALYLGADGLHGFWGLAEAGPDVTPQQFLEVPELQASFEDREMVEKGDRAVMKELGLKFRGRQAWPLFRSYRPGYSPWYLEAGEARFLYHALEQTLAVAERYRSDGALLDGLGEEELLVRVPRQEGDGLVWADEVRPIPEVLLHQIEVVLDMDVIEQLGQIKPNIDRIEADVFMFPAPTRDGEERPYFPYVLMLVEGDSGMILASEMMPPLPSLDAMWANVLGRLLAALARQGMRPREIAVQVPMLEMLLRPVAGGLKIKVRQEGYLALLEEVKGMVMGRFM